MKVKSFYNTIVFVDRLPTLSSSLSAWWRWRLTSDNADSSYLWLPGINTSSFSRVFTKIISFLQMGVFLLTSFLACFALARVGDPPFCIFPSSYIPFYPNFPLYLYFPHLNFLSLAQHHIIGWAALCSDICFPSTIHHHHHHHHPSVKWKKFENQKRSILEGVFEIKKISRPDIRQKETQIGTP